MKRRELIPSADAFIYANRKSIIGLAARHRLPAIYGIPGAAADGGLMYYCVDVVDSYRQATDYVDRILRGEKPADLPVQQPTKFAHRQRQDGKRTRPDCSADAASGRRRGD
jgi:putative ABC transport system substrate-binding protein